MIIPTQNFPTIHSYHEATKLPQYHKKKHKVKKTSIRNNRFTLQLLMPGGQNY